MTERRIIDDASFPNEWPKKEDHEGHEVRWKDGVSKEYGVHGVAVAVDFDICIADGICISVCPTNVFDKMDFPAEQEKIDKKVPNDSGKTLLDRWKADPIRERDCIFCRACEIQCPVQAIKITEGVGPFANLPIPFSFSPSTGIFSFYPTQRDLCWMMRTRVAMLPQ